MSNIISILRPWARRSLLLLIASMHFFVLAAPTTYALTDEDRKQLFRPFYDPNSDLSSCSVPGGGTAQIPDGTLEDYIGKYGQFAFDVGKQYGIPYDAIIAQSALESTWGKSGLTVNANNFFGIKAGSSWTGPVYHADTLEEVDGKMVNVSKASWRAYPTPYEGFKGYGDFIVDNPRYSKALDHPNDPFKYIEEIKAAGYATDSQYVSKVSSVIRRVQAYIAEKKLFPPSSEVVPDSSRPAASDTGSTCGSPSGSLLSVIQIAEQELAKKPVEYDSNVLGYTLGRREPWCADFVSWVFFKAGLPFSGGWAANWQIPAVIDLQAWFKNGTGGAEYFTAGAKLPQAGDVAFYIGNQTPDGGSTSHTNIVISVDEAANTMTTIGGNESNSVKKSVIKIQAGTQSLVGFGRVNK